MRVFEYTARDTQGGRRDGLRQAAASSDVLGWLREQGLTPVNVKEVAGKKAKKGIVVYERRIKAADLSTVFWQLTTMIEGGIPITSALETIGADIDHTRLQKVLQTILESLTRGVTFAEAIAEHPKVFDPLTRSIILAGETSGNMGESLRRIAGFYEKRDMFSKKVKGAMVYPVVVFSVVTLIVIFIMTFIIPRFKDIFEQLGSKMPPFTKAFMGFYDFMAANILYATIALIAGIVGLVMFNSRTKRGHYFFSKFFLSLPLVGKLISESFMVTFCRTMSTLLESGVSVLE